MPVLDLERHGALSVPPDFDWKRAFLQGVKAKKMVNNIKMVPNGDFVRTVEFNVHVASSGSSPVFVLREGKTNN